MAKKRREAQTPDSTPKGATRKPAAACVALLLVTLASVGGFVGWKIAQRDQKPSVSDPINPTAPASHAAAPTTKLQPAVPPLLEPEAQVFARYAGSQSCRECHSAQFESWAKSNHGNAERLPNDAMDATAFSPERTFHHGTQDSTATMKDGKPAVKTLGFDNQQATYPVTRVIGHDPLRQYLDERPGGRLQTLEVS